MNIARSRKTAKVFYLYLTIPLLIITAVLGMIALMTHAQRDGAPAPADAMLQAGSSSSGSASIPRPSVELPLPDSDRSESTTKEPSQSEGSTAGNAALVTAIMGGLTGLMGALTQTLIAFVKMRGKRKSGEDAEDHAQS